MAGQGFDALILDEYQFQFEKPKGGNSEIPNVSLSKNPNDGKKSFAEVTAGTPIAPIFDSAVISDVGGYKSVRINQKAYEHQIQLCSNSLIGRLVLSKGDKPWKVSELKIVLTKLWNITEPWKLISLGRGYFNVFLQSRETKDRVWSRGALDLKPGIFRLQPWVPDFDPNIQNATFAQVWVRLYKLPWEYWHPQILADIAKCVGVLVRIDKTTTDGEFGHFARVLIDVDLSVALPHQVGIEREGYHSSIELVYEYLPPFCPVCSSIGHHPYNCRRNKVPNQGKHEEKDPIPEDLRARAKIREKRVWQRKPPHTSLDRNRNDVGQSINGQTALKTSEGMPKVLDSQSGKSIEIEEVPSSLCLELYDQGTGKEIIPHTNVVPLESPLNIRPLNISIDSPVLQQVEQNSGRANVSWANQGSSWADQFGSDSDSEDAIDTEHIEQLWHSQVTHSSMYEDVNSDPDGWFTVKRKEKYTPISQIEIPVSRDTRNYFPVGTRKSKRQVRLPKKLQPS